MRILLTAIAICTLSFVAGVAGDLSSPPANAANVEQLRNRIELPPLMTRDGLEPLRAGPLPLRRAERVEIAYEAPVVSAVTAKAERGYPAFKAELTPKPRASAKPGLSMDFAR